MKYWKYTIILGLAGGLLAVVGALFSGGGHGGTTDLMWTLFLPVMLFGNGFDFYWVNMLELERQTGLYVPVVLGIVAVGGFLQFAVIGHIVDHILNFVKDSRNKNAYGPIITEPLVK